MKDRQYNSPKKKANKTDNSTAQRKRTKGQQYNSPKKKDKRTNNTTAQIKRTKGQTMSTKHTEN
jgi:hypothetical protein